MRRQPIQDEFTHRHDLTKSQKQWRRYCRDTGRQMGRTAKDAHVDLGLALLSLVAIPNVPLTYYDIAAWCDCSPQAIQNIERDALKKLRNALYFRDRETWEELRDHLARDRQRAHPLNLSTHQPLNFSR